MTYIIDLRDAHDKPTMHRMIAESLSLSAHYGRNLDSLWDSLTGELEIPCEIHLTVCADMPHHAAVRDIFECACAWHRRHGRDVKLFIL